LRRLKELYPKVRVQLWNRKDFRRLLERLGIEELGEELIGQNAKES